MTRSSLMSIKNINKMAVAGINLHGNLTLHFILFDYIFV